MFLRTALAWATPMALFLSGAGAPAATTLLGDVNGDDLIDLRDVVILVNLTGTPGVLSGEAVLIADANQDGSVDSGDPLRVAQIIVGLAAPERLGLPSAIPVTVSYWVREVTPPDGEQDTRGGIASFWVEQKTPAAEEANTVGALAAYWHAEEAPPAKETNTVAPPVSHWFMEEVPPASESDVVQRGTPSYEYEGL